MSFADAISDFFDGAFTLEDPVPAPRPLDARMKDLVTRLATVEQENRDLKEHNEALSEREEARRKEVDDQVAKLNEKVKMLETKCWGLKKWAASVEAESKKRVADVQRDMLVGIEKAIRECMVVMMAHKKLRTEYEGAKNEMEGWEAKCEEREREVAGVTGEIHDRLKATDQKEMGLKDKIASLKLGYEVILKAKEEAEAQSARQKQETAMLQQEYQSSLKLQAMDREEVKRLQREITALKQDREKMMKDYVDEREKLVSLQQEMEKKWEETNTQAQRKNAALIIRNEALLQKQEADKVKLREEYDRLRIKDQKQHLKDLNLAKENCATLIEARDHAVAKFNAVFAENKEFRGGNAMLKTELDNEKIHHQIAVDQVTVLYKKLDGYRRNYEKLLSKLRALNSDYNALLQQKLDVDKTHRGTLCDLNAAMKNIEALEKDRTSSGIALGTLNGDLDEARKEHDVLKSRIARLNNTILKICREKMEDYKVLQAKYDDLSAHTRHLGDQLHKSESQRDAAVCKLEDALRQRQDALEGQLEALKMVQRLKSGEVTLDGKEIGVFDEDDEIVFEEDKKEWKAVSEVFAEEGNEEDEYENVSEGDESEDMPEAKYILKSSE